MDEVRVAIPALPIRRAEGCSRPERFHARQHGEPAPRVRVAIVQKAAPGGPPCHSSPRKSPTGRPDRQGRSELAVSGESESEVLPKNQWHRLIRTVANTSSNGLAQILLRKGLQIPRCGHGKHRDTAVRI